MSASPFENESIRDAYRLIWFTLGDHLDVMKTLKRAFDHIETYQDKRMYYKPKTRRNRVGLDTPQLLQFMLMRDSEELERQQEQEHLEGKRTLREETMLVRFIKRLLLECIFSKSFHTTVALSRILHNYTTSEALKMYGVLVQWNDLKTDDAVREQKKKMMGNLKARFGSFLTSSQGARGEERFLTVVDSKQMYDFVKKCLNLFTLWDSNCVLPESFRTMVPEIPRLAYLGNQPDAEHLIERSRIHTMTHDLCLSRLAQGLNLDPPLERVEVPKISFLNSGGNGSGHQIDLEDPPEPSEKEFNEILRELLRQRTNRRKFSATVLAFIVDGIERARISLDEVETVDLPLTDDDDLIEVVAKEDEGDVLLSTLSLRYSRLFDQKQEWKSSIILEGGQQITMRARSTELPLAQSGGLVLEISYRETNAIRALGLSTRRVSFQIARLAAAFAESPWRVICKVSRKIQRPVLALAIVGLLVLSLQYTRQALNLSVQNPNHTAVENKVAPGVLSPQITQRSDSPPPAETAGQESGPAHEREQQVSSWRPRRGARTENRANREVSASSRSSLEVNENDRAPKLPFSTEASGTVSRLPICKTDIESLRSMIPNWNFPPATGENDTRLVPSLEPKSQPAARDIFLEPSDSQKARYAIVIGVDTDGYPQIKSPAQASVDAGALSTALISYAGFPRDQVTLLASNLSEANQPTLMNIEDSFFGLRETVPKDGFVFVAFTGPGIVYNGQPYIVPSDIQLDNAASARYGGISVDKIREWVCETSASHAVVMVDASFDIRPTGRSRAKDSSPYEGRCRSQRNSRGSLHRGLDQQIAPTIVTLLPTFFGEQAFESGEYTEWRPGRMTESFVDGLKGVATTTKGGEVTISGFVEYVTTMLPQFQTVFEIGSGQPSAMANGGKSGETVRPGAPLSEEHALTTLPVQSKTPSAPPTKGADKNAETTTNSFIESDRSVPSSFSSYAPRSLWNLLRKRHSKSALGSPTSDELSGIWTGRLSLSGSERAFTLKLETKDSQVLAEWAEEERPSIKLQGMRSGDHLEFAGEHGGETFVAVATLKKGKLFGRRYIDKQLRGTWEATREGRTNFDSRP